MMTKVGLYWQKLDAADQWEERALIGGLYDSTAIFANNSTEPTVSAKLQYGGVGMIALSEAKHQTTARGKDPSGMGRWVWMRMEGKEGHHIRFITAYHPCQSGGASSVFQQHSAPRAMAVQHDFRNPRTAILEDLAKVIQEWKMVGDHVVLGMDANRSCCCRS
jgi:hypothetical protein